MNCPSTMVRTTTLLLESTKAAVARKETSVTRVGACKEVDDTSLYLWDGERIEVERELNVVL